MIATIAVGRRSLNPLLLFAPTIFVSAWLLFQIQPIFAKMALPLLGGTAAVWNTALVFFQAALLLGYLYAHVLGTRVALRWQVAIHLGVLLAAFVVLPVAIGESWRNPPASMPIPWLIGLLTACVGLPFFAVSANAPLLQGWFARSGHAAGGDPYFLYAASNCGSMLALLSYPVLVEPYLRLAGQSQMWTAGYTLLAVLIAGCGALAWRQGGTRSAAPGPTAPRGETRPDAAIGWRTRLHWIALAFVPSGLLVAATTFMTTDLAAIPLLWIVPLTLYLLSFVIVFARRPLFGGRIGRRGLSIVHAILLCLAAVVSTWSMSGATYVALALVLTTLFVSSCVCHGELVRRRPAAQRLTEFYVWMSLGGILGSAFCALLAPVLFDSVFEYAILLVLAGLLRPGKSRAVAPTPRPLFAAAALREAAVPLAIVLIAAALALDLAPATITDAAVLVLAAFVAVVALGALDRPLRFGASLVALVLLGVTFSANAGSQASVYRERTFFATHQVLSLEQGRYFALAHGSTIHGVQAADPARWREPLGPFHGDSGAGRIFAALSHQQRVPRAVAVLGLGAGALACYRTPGQNWSFFEIDPAVVRLAPRPAILPFHRRVHARCPLRHRRRPPVARPGTGGALRHADRGRVQLRFDPRASLHARGDCHVFREAVARGGDRLQHHQPVHESRADDGGAGAQHGHRDPRPAHRAAARRRCDSLPVLVDRHGAQRGGACAPDRWFRPCRADPLGRLAHRRRAPRRPRLDR